MHERRQAPGPGAQDRTTSHPITCPRCGSGDPSLRWQTFANGTRHIRVTCRCCGRFIKYASQTHANVERANTEPSDDSREVRP